MILSEINRKRIKNPGRRKKKQRAAQLSNQVTVKSSASFSFKKLIKIWEYKPMDTARLFLGFVIGALLVFLLSYNYYFREENNEQLEQLTEENNTLIGEKNEIQKSMMN